MNPFYNGSNNETNEDKKVVYFKDGDVETLNPGNEKWEFCTTNYSFCSSLESTCNHDLNKLFDYFGNRSFMNFVAQAFP